MSVYLALVVAPRQVFYRGEFLRPYWLKYSSTRAVPDEDLPEILRQLVNYPGAIDPMLYGYFKKEDLFAWKGGWKERACNLGSRVSGYLDNGARVVLFELDVDCKAEECPSIRDEEFSDFIKQNVKEIRTFEGIKGFDVKSKKIDEVFPIKLDHEKVFRVDMPKVKQPIIDALEAYVKRIETYDGDFQHGFWFFKESRAANRQANYLLAKQMLVELKKDDASISNVFSNLEGKRKLIVDLNKLVKSADRGMNSSELKDIINLAHKQVQKSKPSKPGCF